MGKNRLQWSTQEEMMATAYENIADSFAYIAKYMKAHVNTVKNGMGIVTDGDLEEVLNMLKDMINKNLHNVSQMRVDISMGPIRPKTPTKPTSPIPPKSPSPWTSDSTDGNNYQFESKKPVKKITESQLKSIVAESVKRILKESIDDPEFDNVSNEDIAKFNGHYTDVTVPEHCLCYLVNGETEGYSEEEIQKMDKFENKWMGKILGGLTIGDVCIPLDDRYPSFTASNDVYGYLGCDCYRFLVPLK